MKIIYYGTDEFDKFVEGKPSISLYKAEELAEKLRKKNMATLAVLEFFL